jgi:hypothetical protein
LAPITKKIHGAQVIVGSPFAKTAKAHQLAHAYHCELKLACVIFFNGRLPYRKPVIEDS